MAVLTLTGLRPLAHFGARSARLHDRLTAKYPKQASDEKAAAEKLVGQQKVTLEDLLKDGDRLRLYGLVARWHDVAHPGQPFTACPVCDRDLTRLGAIPRDALLDTSVAEALEQARKADAAMLPTVKPRNSGPPALAQEHRCEDGSGCCDRRHAR